MNDKEEKKVLNARSNKPYINRSYQDIAKLLGEDIKDKELIKEHLDNLRIFTYSKKSVIEDYHFVLGDFGTGKLLDMPLPNDDKIERSIEDLLQSREFNFCSVDMTYGRLQIYKKVDIERILEGNPDKFRRSYFISKNGNTLYTLATNKISIRERIAEFIEHISSLVKQ